MPEFFFIRWCLRSGATVHRNLQLSTRRARTGLALFNPSPCDVVLGTKEMAVSGIECSTPLLFIRQGHPPSVRTYSVRGGGGRAEQLTISHETRRVAGGEIHRRGRRARALQRPRSQLHRMSRTPPDQSGRCRGESSQIWCRRTWPHVGFGGGEREGDHALTLHRTADTYSNSLLLPESRAPNAMKPPVSDAIFLASYALLGTDALDETIGKCRCVRSCR